MPRVIWKGAVSFGLVHIPVALYPATRSDDLDFDWLDRRTMDRVGYKRINKTTGKEVPREQIVRGYAYEKDRYVILTDEDIRAANPVSTQTVDLLTFVDAAEIPFLYLDTPYFLAPDRRGEKVYALLREALTRSQKIGVANVVLHTKQHLAALIPMGPVLVLHTLRWSNEVRDWSELDVPEEGAKAAKLTAKEIDMAEKLIDDMSGKWDPAEYHDTFRHFDQDRSGQLDHQGDKSQDHARCREAPAEPAPAAWGRFAQAALPMLTRHPRSRRSPDGPWRRAGPR